MVVVSVYNVDRAPHHTHNFHPTSYILPDASRESGQKTRMVKRSVSPTYNHTMVYDGFQTSDLREACAELTVWHREGFKTHILGGVRLSCGTGECPCACSTFTQRHHLALIRCRGTHSNTQAELHLHSYTSQGTLFVIAAEKWKLLLLPCSEGSRQYWC